MFYGGKRGSENQLFHKLERNECMKIGGVTNVRYSLNAMCILSAMMKQSVVVGL